MVSFVLDATTLALDPRDMNIGRYTNDPTGRSAAVTFSLISVVARSSKIIFNTFFLKKRTCVGAIIAAGSIVDTGTIAILGGSVLCRL